MNPSWDDEALTIRSDSLRVRRYRRLQSWYRENQLGLKPGRSNDTTTAKGVLKPARQVGSLLPFDGRSPVGVNFISREAFHHAEDRITQATSEKAALDPVRLRRNMLSSMPMCFNIFGTLRMHPNLLTELLNALLPLNVKEVEAVICEAAPLPAADYLDDRSAFDAVIFFVDTAGSRRFLAVETKYTEAFSQLRYDEIKHPRYVDACGYGWFSDGALDVLKGIPTNQLWRNTMLASSLETNGNSVWKTFDRGDVAVFCLAEDVAAQKCVDAVRTHLVDPERLHHVTLENMTSTAAGIPGVETFARRFGNRYLHPDDLDERVVDPLGPDGRSPNSVFD